MHEALRIPGRLLEAFLRSRLGRWAVRGPWQAPVLLIGIVVLFSFPSYDVALVLHEMDDNWQGVFTQVDAPFTDHTAQYPGESHSGKLAYRFVPALLLRALGVRTMQGAMIVQFVLMMVFHALLYHVLLQLLRDPRQALATALPFCFVITGHVYASDYRGIFDTLALDFLLLAILLRRTAWVIPALLLAFFTDERALMASPAIVLLGIFLDDQDRSMGSMIRGLCSRTALLIVGAWALYFGLRFSLGAVFGLRTESVDLWHYFKQNIPRLGYGLYIGLEGLYILAGMAATFLFRERRFAFLIAFLGCALLLHFFALSVVDINRSLSYLAPWLVLLMVVVARSYSWTTVVQALGWSIAVSFVYTDFWPLPVQLFRMAYVTRSLLPWEAWVAP